jgi:hypothetical protein
MSSPAWADSRNSPEPDVPPQPRPDTCNVLPHDKASLDIFWHRGESLADSNQRAPPRAPRQMPDRSFDRG